MDIKTLTMVTSLFVATACASDENLNPDADERYQREFIKEFGVPADNHSWSMATTAGLKIKTSHPVPVVVTADVDGEEYLFANTIVPAGVHPMPVTIPSFVTQLKVMADGEVYECGVNSLLELDAHTDRGRASGISVTVDGTQI